MKEIPIVFIGHKDHGKSTLIGRLLLDTESIKESRVNEIREIDDKKFRLAHLVDSFKEERENGMTIETTRAILKGKRGIYQLIDVPGHVELISNMLTGASGAKAALLLVSIEDGVKEQTYQHLEIAKVLGIEQLGVVINKIDKKNYQKDSFEKVVSETKEILIRTGFAVEKISFFPISALNGDNVVSKSPKTSWYKGTTLINFIKNNIEIDNLSKEPLRFLIQDKYSEKVFVGRIESGELKVGQEILFLPQNIKGRVTAIRDSETGLKKALAGKNIGIVLEKIKEIHRGTVGCLEDFKPTVGNILKGEIFWLQKPSKKELIYECGTSQIKGELLEPKIIKAGEKSLYKISLRKNIAFDPSGKTILGKIILKDNGRIIAAGNVK